MLKKQEVLLGRDTRVESRRIREPRKTALPHDLQSWFYGNGIRFWVASHSDSRVLPVGARLVQPRWMQREGFWEVVGRVVSPFDLSCTLPVAGDFLVQCSLPGPPVIKQLIQMVTMAPDQGGRFQSVCFPQQPGISS